MPKFGNVGDKVEFFFRASGGRTLEMRPATITKVYDDTVEPPLVDLEVELEESDLRQGFTTQQTHVTYADVPESGRWRKPRNLTGH